MPIFNRHYVGQGNVHQPDALFMLGPFLEAQIHLPQPLINLLTSQGQTLPAPKPGIAIIDTGATRTCVDQQILTSLNLNPVGVMSLGTAAGPTQNYIYAARIEFTTIHMVLDSTVIGVSLQGQNVNGQPVIALIGRDLLRRGLFVYSGTGGFFTLAF